MDSLCNKKYDEFRLTLALTFSCNLSCTYCYVKPQSNRVMTRAIAESGIKLAIERLNPSAILNIGFFGGEPLLEPELLVWSLHRARELAAPLNIEVRPFLTTNGTVLTDSLLATLLEEGVEVTVSVDGTEEAHNTFRKRPDGSGSYKKAIKGLKLASTKLKNCGVNMVIQPETVHKVAEGVMELSEIVSRFDLSIDYGASWDFSSLKELERQFIEVGDFYVLKGREGTPLSISFIESKLAAIANGGLIRKCRCKPGTDELTVSPAGDLIACERQMKDKKSSSGKPAWLGTVAEGLRKDRLKNLKELCSSIPAGCNDCEISEFCLNNCMCNNMCRTGKPSSPDGMICFTEKLSLTIANNVLVELSEFTKVDA